MAEPKKDVTVNVPTATVQIRIPQNEDKKKWPTSVGTQKPKEAS